MQSVSNLVKKQRHSKWYRVQETCNRSQAQCKKRHVNGTKCNHFRAQCGEKKVCQRYQLQEICTIDATHGLKDDLRRGRGGEGEGEGKGEGNYSSPPVLH